MNIKEKIKSMYQSAKNYALIPLVAVPLAFGSCTPANMFEATDARIISMELNGDTTEAFMKYKTRLSEDIHTMKLKDTSKFYIKSLDALPKSPDAKNFNPVKIFIPRDIITYQN